MWGCCINIAAWDRAVFAVMHANGCVPNKREEVHVVHDLQWRLRVEDLRCGLPVNACSLLFLDGSDIELRSPCQQALVAIMRLTNTVAKDLGISDVAPVHRSW